MKANPSLNMLEVAATRLGELAERVAFVGGITTSVYADHEMMPEPRVTDDVDCVVEVATKGSMDEFEREMRKKGFQHADRPICRWKHGALTVDVVPTKGDRIYGFSNRWYEEAFEARERRTLPGGREINVFPLPYFIATKIEAYRDRGKGDFRGSHDFEDIVFVTAWASTVVASIKKSNASVKDSLIKSFAAFAADPLLDEGIQCTLSQDDQIHRVRIRRIFAEIAALK